VGARAGAYAEPVRKGKRSEPRGDQGEVSQLIEQSTQLWEEGDLEGALAAAAQACRLDPRSSVAHHCRAAALAELDRLEEAREACERGVELAPHDPEALLYAADLHLHTLADEEGGLERGLELARRGVRAARKEGDAELEAECLLLCGVGEEQLGDLPGALADVEAALRHLGDDPDALLERGVLLFELCRMAEARAQLEAVLRLDPELAAAHHYLGLIEERAGHAGAAERRFKRARKLAPDDFPRPVHLGEGEFDGAVEAALAELPPRLREYLANVAITVEELPADADLTASSPPLSPLVLGMFRGSPLADKGVMDVWAHFPSSIVLYQRNLERFARDREELIEQIGITLLHEVGHFLGLDEDDLRERGLA